MDKVASIVVTNIGPRVASDELIRANIHVKPGDVINGGTEFYCSIDPRLSQSKLLVGTRVLLNEAYVVIGDLGFARRSQV